MAHTQTHIPLFIVYIYIYIYHHHHVVPLARISLTLSLHFSQSFIVSGRSSGLHPVSSHSCCMYVRGGRPAGVHRSTSLMSSSLLLQQCHACLVRLTCIIFVMGGRWPYSWCLVGCCRQDEKCLETYRMHLVSPPAVVDIYVYNSIFTLSVFGLLSSSLLLFFTTFRPICPPALFRCLSNLGTFTKLRTTSFIESTGFACSDSVSPNRVQELSIPVLLLTSSQD